MTSSDPLADARPARAETRPTSSRDLLKAKLLSYSELCHGWDGDDGVPASPGAISDAITMLDKLPKDIRLPYPQIASDGEVSLYWLTDGAYAEFGFFGDGTFSFCARYLPEGEDPASPKPRFLEITRDICEIKDRTDWPDNLFHVLHKVATTR